MTLLEVPGVQCEGERSNSRPESDIDGDDVGIGTGILKKRTEVARRRFHGNDTGLRVPARH